VSILGWLLTAHLALQAAKQLASEGLDAEAIDVRALAPLDWPTIEASARKSGRVVIVEEGPKTGGVAAEIAASLCERLPGLRVARVASADVPVPFSPPLENAYRPDVARVVAAARSLCVTGRS
jgi:pyruvate dehydrogenase E1 component beta subunit